MTDDKSFKSPFSNLTSLDTSLMRSTKPKEDFKPANQQTGKPDYQQTSLPVKQQAVKPANQLSPKRSSFQKVTYHLSPEAIDAIEDAKRILRREYDSKTTLEEIAEIAILEAYNDLIKNQQTSKLVNQITSKPESHKT